MLKDDITIPPSPPIKRQAEKEFFPVDPMVLNDLIVKLNIDITNNRKITGPLTTEYDVWRYSSEENNYRDTLATILNEIVNRITELEENPHNVSITP